MFFFVKKGATHWITDDEGTAFEGKAWAGARKKVADSLKEFRRWRFLIGELAAGRLQSLKCQKTYWLHGPNGARITSYVADFTYHDAAGRFIVEDVKSEKTRKLRMYQIKKAWVKDEYGIDIIET